MAGIAEVEVWRDDRGFRTGGLEMEVKLAVGGVEEDGDTVSTTGWVGKRVCGVWSADSKGVG